MRLATTALRVSCRTGFVLCALASAMTLAAAAPAAVPTAHVTPSLTPGPAYNFQTAGGRVRCELYVGAHGTGINCANARRGATLNWSGDRFLSRYLVPPAKRSRNVPAGTRLAIHVPSDRLVYLCRAYRTAMQCTHSATHRGFIVGLSVTRLV